MTKKNFNSTNRAEKEYKESNKEKRELRGEINRLTKQVKRLEKELSKSNNRVEESFDTTLADLEKQENPEKTDSIKCSACNGIDIVILNSGENKKVHICKSCQHKWTITL